MHIMLFLHVWLIYSDFYMCCMLQGNDIILHYRHSQATTANTDLTLQVPFFEVNINCRTYS